MSDKDFEEKQSVELHTDNFELNPIKEYSKKIFEHLGVDTMSLLKGEVLSENFREKSVFEKEIGDGVNKPELWSYKDSPFLLKRKSNEDLLTANETGIRNQYKHEYLSWVMDKVIGTDVVPFTSIVEISSSENKEEKEFASVQYFIPDATPAELIDLQNPEKLTESQRESLVKIFLLDYFTFNLDREGQNFVEKDGKIYGIDNGVTFGVHPPQHLAHRVLEKMSGSVIPSEVLDGVKNLYAAIQTNTAFRDDFKKLLTESVDDVDRVERLMPMIVSRLEKVISEKKLPNYEDYVFSQDDIFEMLIHQ